MKKEKSIKSTPKWLYPAIITGFVFLIYGNCIKNEYSLDDEIVTSTYSHGNSRIEKGIKGIPGIFTSRYVETNDQSFDYRPLVLTTFAVEYHFFRKNPHISHFINILLYIAICLLIFSILKNIFTASNVIFPLLATLLFVAHPIHTEVVASLKNRDELMGFFFGLCSLKYSLKYIDEKKIWELVIAAFLMWLAFLSKKTVVVFVPLIPITIFFFKPINFSKIIFPAMGIIAALLLFVVFKKLLIHTEPVKRIFVFTENPLFFEPNIFNRIPAALYIILYYLKILIFPFPLSSYYGYNSIPIAAWDNPFVWISIIIHMALLIFAIKKYKSNKIISYSILFYLISIAPYSNLIRPAVGIIAERFAFASSLGFCIIIAYVLISGLNGSVMKNHFGKRNSFPFIALITGILIFFSGLTINRNGEWKDLNTLFATDVKRFDNSHNLHLLSAKLLEKKIYTLPEGVEKNNKINEVIRHCNKITEIVIKEINQFPTDYMSRNNLGTIYLEYLNKPDIAQVYFYQALAIKSDYTEALYNLGFSFEKRMMPDSAIKYFEKTLKADKFHLLAYTHINQQLLNKRDFSRAIEVNEQAIKFYPGKAEFYINMGNSYMLKKDTINGIMYFEKGLILEPNNNNLRKQIVNFLKKSGFEAKSHELEHY